jgi:hypothetical protein
MRRATQICEGRWGLPGSGRVERSSRRSTVRFTLSAHLVSRIWRPLLIEFLPSCFAIGCTTVGDIDGRAT